MKGALILSHIFYFLGRLSLLPKPLTPLIVLIFMIGGISDYVVALGAEAGQVSRGHLTFILQIVDILDKVDIYKFMLMPQSLRLLRRWDDTLSPMCSRASSPQFLTVHDHSYVLFGLGVLNAPHELYILH